MKGSTHYVSLVSIISVVFFFSVIGTSQHEELKLQKVTENLYVLGSTIGGNIAFLVTEEGVLCVDAKYFPYQGERVVKTIRQITCKPIKYLVYTHHHGDHTQGAQCFPTSTMIIAHQNTLKKMKEGGLVRIKQDKTIYFPRQLKALEKKVEKLKAEQSPTLAEAEQELENKRFQIKDYERLKLMFPEITFIEKVCIRLGGKILELRYLGQGHTEGDILVYFPDKRVVHMGDLLSHPGEVEERVKSLNIMKRIEKMKPEQIENIVRSMENQIKILEKAAALDFEKAIPGHGKITDKKGVINHIAQSKKLLNKVKKIIR